ncbi:hypothetical protein JCM3775_005887 [Rhodotorula graminis]
MSNEIFISASSPKHAPPSSRLPNELLDSMFKHAYDDKVTRKLGATPLCRRLFPIQRTHLYRRVEVNSYQELASFCRYIGT